MLIVPAPFRFWPPHQLFCYLLFLKSRHMSQGPMNSHIATLCEAIELQRQGQKSWFLTEWNRRLGSLAVTMCDFRVLVLPSLPT